MAAALRRPEVGFVFPAGFIETVRADGDPHWSHTTEGDAEVVALWDGVKLVAAYRIRPAYLAEPLEIVTIPEKEFHGHREADRPT